MASTPQRTDRVRMAFVPGVLAAILLLAGLALVGGDWFVVVRFGVAILAAIMCAFAIRGRQYWWLVGLVPVVVLWNPVWPIALDDLSWRLAHVAAAALVVVSGLFITVPVEEDRTRRR